MSETTEVAVIETRALVPTQVFAPGGVLQLVEKMEAEVRAVRTDISTPKGRAAIKSLAYKVARSKTALDEMGKKLNDDARAQINAVDADRRLVRERLDALAAEVRAPLTAWEAKEAARVKAHEDALAAIPEAPGYGQVETSAEIALRLNHLRNYPERDWQEFQQRFEETLAAEIGRMAALHDAAATREAEQAEQARLRAEAEERARQEAIRLQREREARIAAEAAEAARREAEQRAAAEAAEAARRALEERERAEHAARAIAEQARAEQLAAERQAREAEQRAAAAEAKAAEDARVAEAARVAAEQRAERDRVAAVEAERRRVAEEAEAQRRADDQRAADRAHRGRINSAAVAALLATGISEEQARVVVTAIISGSIPNVSIRY